MSRILTATLSVRSCNPDESDLHRWADDGGPLTRYDDID